jgi:thiamine pyrophosphate-dependent acetolactate synthase large subunit-like protein
MRLPLVLIGMGRGVVPEDHPLCFGPTRVGVREADVVLLIATRLNYNLAFGRPPLFAEDVKMVQIDIEAGEVGRNRPIEVGMVGDVKGVLRQMTEEARERGGRKESPSIL